MPKHNKKKLLQIIKKARIRPGDEVLEIGSGWGSMSLAIATYTQAAKITTITLSKEQHDLVSQRIKDAKLQDRITVKICDYRELQGKYDRIISVEMLEAVGHEYFPSFFASCDRLLKPNGLAVIQVITMPEARYASYRKSCDWIQKYVFPGAVVPSLSALTEAMSKSSDFLLEEVENIGPNYAPTLRVWRKRFIQNIANAKKLGLSDIAIKTWEYYFAYCEAGFITRTLNVLQIVLTREANELLISEDLHLHLVES